MPVRKRLRQNRDAVRPLRGALRITSLAALALFTVSCATAADWPPAPRLQISPDADAGPLPPSVTAETVSSGNWRCTFRYKADGTPKKVALAGTFTGWASGAVAMNEPDPSGVWSASVPLAAGVHQYKFIVDGDRWLPDPQNPDGLPDGHQGQNSVLRLGYLAHAKDSPARVGDGHIESRALEHRPDVPLYFQRTGPAQALIRLRTQSHDLDTVSVAVQSGRQFDLTPVEVKDLFTLWEGVADFPASPAGDDQFHYTFVLADGALQASGPETYGVPVLQKDAFHTPDWAKNVVWYQIMLDRFRNGNAANDRQPVRPWTSEWFTPSAWEGQDGQSFYKYYVFDRQYGGDFDGLEEKLPYLKQLGVSAIYLLPIFKAESNHKYNGENYIHVDDHFGTLGDYDEIAAKEDLNDPSTWHWTESDQRFLRFLRTAHAQGFRVIIDGVFNHVGTRHPAFQDVKKNGPKSKYVEWFNITSWDPFKYEGWFGNDSLPVFKKSKDGLASEQVKQHIFNVTRRWLAPDGDPKNGIDGWRLDVPNEIPAPFWVEWRDVVKQVNPDAYITGEIWDRADEWLDGKHFDAVMNYEFSKAVVAWVFDKKRKISVSELDRRLRELRVMYPLEATLVMQNLMDSHDTDRIASMAHNPDRNFDDANRLQDNGPKYDNSKPTPADYARARVAALIQMTYIGAPMVYYGDEVGMWGSDDPTCRKPMLWEDLQPYEQSQENFVMKDLLTYYQKIIALRKAHPALRTGTIRTLLADDTADVWVFLRTDADEQLVVAVNAADQGRAVTVPLPMTAPNKWTGVFNASGVSEASDHKLQVRVPAVGGVVLHAATPK